MKGLEGMKFGRYELRHRIAQGAMSEVFLGYDHRVRRQVAVKVLYGSDEPFVRRFEREALAVGALSHDHILPLYDFGEQCPWYYLVMPFIEGGTLRDYLYTRGRLTQDEAGNLLEQIASALQYAHNHGVIHRDVKPSNILLRLDGHAYLADFGLAKAKVDADAHSHSGIGAGIGTPEYMAPEQSDGINDPRSDIYSLAIILYQMLTGHVPFTGDSPVTVMLKHLQVPPPRPSQINQDIPQEIEVLILKALAKKPEERYQEANDFASAYKQALLQERIRIQTLPSFAGRKQGTFLFALVLCLLIMLIIFPLTLNFLWNKVSFSFDKEPSGIPPLQATVTAMAQAKMQATLAAQARVEATEGITPPLNTGKILYYNEMISPGGGWIDDGKQCAFSPQGYSVSTYTPRTVAWCYNNQQRFSNAIITVQARLIRGNFYGIIFRLNPTSAAFYALELNSASQYRYQRALGGDPNRWLTLIDWTSSNAITAGYGQRNDILVIANRADFRFYINHQLIISTFSDNTYHTGLIGLLAGGDNIKGTEAVFSNVMVFQI